jgi:hypothetical protein
VDNIIGGMLKKTDSLPMEENHTEKLSGRGWKKIPLQIFCPVRSAGLAA